MTTLPDRLPTALSGRYRIERELGRGGMATVYLARDLRHDRDVAIKVLQSALVAHVSGERFLREIRVTAQLTHPQILPLLDSGFIDGDAESLAGYPYYVMPFVPGETLRARIQRDGRLGIDETVRIVREVADALDYANGRGIVHRDIKPENILLLEGHAIVADFGIARALDAGGGNVTSTGVIVGTPVYMSPEQAAGDATIDGRSDQYSLACVAYEMLTGHPPFSDKTPLALIAAHALDPVPSPRATRADVAPVMDAAIRRAMSKARADRFGTSTDFASALSTPHVAPRNLRHGAGVVVATVLALALTVLAYRTYDARRREATGAQARVAVLPFRSVSPDPADRYFAEGMTDEIISSLSSIPGVNVIARSSVVAFANDKRTNAEIARSLDVASLIEGSVRKEGEKLRIDVNLLDPATGESRWRHRYDKTLTEVFAIQQDVATAVASALKVALLGDRTPRAATTDAGAYEEYMKARAEVINEGGLLGSAKMRPKHDRAIELLRSAVHRDTAFAIAWAALAGEYSSLIFGYGAPPAIRDSAVTALSHAFALDSTLAEAYRSRSNLEYMREGGWEMNAALRDALRAVALKPGWADARATLGSLLFHIGLFPEAMHEMEVALSLDPTNGFVTYRIPRIMWQQQRFDDALLAYRSNRVRGKAAASAEEAMVLGYLGRAPEGMALLDSLATTQATLVSDIAAVRAALLARMGKASDAREQIRIAESAGASISHFHHAAYAIAVASALLGDSRGAVTWLERTARDGMPALALFENDPALAQVRRTPEYAALRTRLAAERDGYRRIMSAAAYSTRDNNP